MHIICRGSKVIDSILSKLRQILLLNRNLHAIASSSSAKTYHAPFAFTKKRWCNNWEDASKRVPKALRNVASSLRISNRNQLCGPEVHLVPEYSYSRIRFRTRDEHEADPGVAVHSLTTSLLCVLLLMACSLLCARAVEIGDNP